MEGPDGKTYAVFLAVRPYEGNYYNTGRETFIAPVEWKEGWPIIDPHNKGVQYSYNTSFKEVKQKDAQPQSGNFQYTLTFEKELDPLIMNIHGETVHTGKRPERLAAGTQKRTELIRLRREMKEAIQAEDYEHASKLRDEIRRIDETG